MAELTFTVQWDWDNDGDFTTAGDDITAYVRELRTSAGFADPLAHVASVGRMELLIDNTSMDFSPNNTEGTWYSKQWINAPIRVQCSIDGAAAFTVWRGYTAEVDPAPGAIYGPRTTRVMCEDILGIYARASISLPLQQNLTMSQLLNQIGAEVFKTSFATGTITFTGAPSAGQTVTVGERVYTFQSSVGATSYAVLIGATAATNARNLAAAINDDTGAAGSTQLYGDSTLRSREVSASVSSGVITVTAIARGTLGNSIGLSENASNCTVSGANLTGGADGPAGLTDYETGKRTFDVAADRWHEDRTTALRAVMDVVQSEFGYCWVARDGTLTTWDKDREFELPAEPATVEYDDGQFFGLSGSIGTMIRNRATVSYEPRGETTNQVIAKANNTIIVPGTTEGLRWGRNVGYPNSGDAGALDAGVKVIRLPFVQNETGNVIGAIDVITPRPGTDYQAHDESGQRGYDYTNNGLIRISTVVTGSGVECTITNSALGALYLSDFQVRGKAIIGYDQQQIVREDATSIATYQRRGIPYSVSLPSGDDFAEQIAYYLVSHYKDPAYQVSQIFVHDASRTLSGVAPIEVEIGHTLFVRESQTATDNTFIVRGQNLSISNYGKTVELSWPVKRVDDVTYWILGDATYGVLGSTTRLAL